MPRYRIFIVLLTVLIISEAHGERSSVSSATDTSEAPSGGLKVMKNASRRDPGAIAVELTSPEAQDRGHAAEALGRLGKSAEPETKGLIEALTDFATYLEEGTTHIVSVEAATALRQIDPGIKLSPKLLSRLVRTAGSDPEHRLVPGGWVARCGAQPEALATLAALGPLAQSVLPDVIRLNRKACIQGRAFVAAQAIGSLSEDQLPRLENLFGDADPEVRRSVAEYIGEVHLAGGATALGRAMNDISTAVRLDALEALEKIHPEGEGRVPLVKPFLQEDSAAIRRQALHFLLRLAPDSALTLALLKERLADSDPSLVMESAVALSRIQPRNPKLLEALIRLAKATDTVTGSQAAELLKTSGSRDPMVAEALQPYLERERQEKIDKAVLNSTPEERETNARSLKVISIRIAKGIKAEQPDHVAHVFAAKSGRLYCWNSVTVKTAPAALRQAWFQDGREVYETILVVPETEYHLWSAKRVHPGKWRVDVTLPGSDEPIASSTFLVTK